MPLFLDEMLFSSSDSSDSSDYDSDAEFFEMVDIIRRMIDLLRAKVVEEEREEQEARRRTKYDSTSSSSSSGGFEFLARVALAALAADEEDTTSSSSARKLRSSGRRRVKVKVKSEPKSSRRRRLAKEKEQAEAESLSCSIARDCEEVASDRRECSEEISDATSSKIMYTGAVLDVCYRKLGFYPEVESFVQHEMVNFPSVKGQYSYNQPPKLIMLDDAGQCKEIIRIDNWKRGQILHFLRENLKPTSGV